MRFLDITACRPACEKRARNTKIFNWLTRNQFYESERTSKHHQYWWKLHFKSNGLGIKSEQCTQEHDLSGKTLKSENWWMGSLSHCLHKEWNDCTAKGWVEAHCRASPPPPTHPQPNFHKMSCEERQTMNWSLGAKNSSTKHRPSPYFWVNIRQMPMGINFVQQVMVWGIEMVRQLFPMHQCMTTGSLIHGRWSAGWHFCPGEVIQWGNATGTNESPSSVSMQNYRQTSEATDKSQRNGRQVATFQKQFQKHRCFPGRTLLQLFCY